MAGGLVIGPEYPSYGREMRVHYHERVPLDVDWVMVGVALPDGRVALFASTEMGRTDLRYTSAVVTDRMKVTNVVQTAYGYDLSARLSMFVYVAGSNYEEAMIRLFAEWRPGGPPVAIETGD